MIFVGEERWHGRAYGNSQMMPKNGLVNVTVLALVKFLGCVLIENFVWAILRFFCGLEKGFLWRN